MKFTTLCYIESDDRYLMLHRVSKEKKNDPNAGKWIGVGGHFEDRESPEECMLREVQEETGLIPATWRQRGIITFVSDQWETEYMHLFTAQLLPEDAQKELPVCDEGELAWVDKTEVMTLPLWEGDKVFLKLLDTEEGFFSLKLCYQGEKLVNAVLNGERIAIAG